MHVLTKIDTGKKRVCHNLADVVCPISIYEPIVLSPGEVVVDTWQSGQVPAELRAEGGLARHTVAAGEMQINFEKTKQTKKQPTTVFTQT